MEIAAGNKAPLKCGICLIDHLLGDHSVLSGNVEGIEEASIVYNKEKSLMSIQKEAQAIPGTEYRLYLGHSDMCPNRLY